MIPLTFLIFLSDLFYNVSSNVYGTETYYMTKIPIPFSKQTFDFVGHDGETHFHIVLLEPFCFTLVVGCVGGRPMMLAGGTFLVSTVWGELA